MNARTVKRWMILIVVMVVLGGLSFSAQRFQIKRLARSVAEQADVAAKEADFEKAERLYREHLVVVPDDTEIQIKYADTLLKQPPLPKRQLEARQIYVSVLTRFPGREDVRKRQMDLKFAMGQLKGEGAEADLQILLNKPENKTNGNLLFLMGRCAEDGKNDLQAKGWYEAAIKQRAPQRMEAYQRLALLLRSADRLNQPQSADQVIEEMVQSSPNDYQTYLIRSSYRRHFGLPGSRADFQKALKLANDEPATIIQLAKLAELETGYTESKQILEMGLKKHPAVADFYQALAELESLNHHNDLAIEILERALKSTTNNLNARFLLADLLARAGNTSKLLLHIEDLKNSGIAPVYVQLLTAQYYLNSKEVRKARQLLLPIESIAGLPSKIKSQVNIMLAQCYNQSGEDEMQQEAYLRALSANPRDAQARLGLIAQMTRRGDIEGAIKEYRGLVKQNPQLSLLLAQQLLLRSRQRAAAETDWEEISSLIGAAEKSSPNSVEPLLFRAETYAVRHEYVKAQDQLDKIKSRFPKNVQVWCVQAELMIAKEKFAEARELLDQAEKLLGDSVELRITRGRLAIAKKGPEVLDALNNLSRNLQAFTQDGRRRLLQALGIEFYRLQDLQRASQMFSQLADLDPNNLDARLTLVDVALHASNSDEIEKNIKLITQIEGKEGTMGPFCQVKYLIWQAEKALKEKRPEEAVRLRTTARDLLNELNSRRPEWALIPVELAQLEQQEIRQGGLTDRQIEAKEQNIIRYYRRAIDLGQRIPAIVRDTIRLLFKNKRGGEALDLLNAVPLESQLASDLGKQAVEFAVGNRDYQRAEEIARKAIAAKPGDMSERVLLIKILLDSGRQAEAEAVTRQMVEFSKTDPDRWSTLVRFFIITKQQEKAASAIKEAEANIPQSQAPLALALCCEMLGSTYEGVDEILRARYYAEAKQWYEKANAIHPDDLVNARGLIDFLRRTKQMTEVEGKLDAILKRGSNTQNPELAAWARRTLALTLCGSSDPKQVRRALTLMESSSEQSKETNQVPRAPNDLEDLRVIARVLDAQRSIPDRTRAIRILESLTAKNTASVEDRLLLARLDEMDGNWAKGLDIYRDLNSKMKSSRDSESLSVRPEFLFQFAFALLRNHKGPDDQLLAEAQEIADELRRLQPDQFNVINLQVSVNRARNQLDKAAELIQSFAIRPNLPPLGIKALAELAEKIDRFDLSEELYRQYAAVPTTRDGKIMLALFLGRRGRTKDALALCEPFWANPRDMETIASTSVEILLSSNEHVDQPQIASVTARLEHSIKQKPDSLSLMINLAALREFQGQYDQAKELYQKVVNQVASNPAASAPKKHIIAASYNNLAWLMAIKDGQDKDALVDINHAIALTGPLPDFLDTRGVILLSLKDVNSAINDLEIAAKADPSPGKLFHLAQAYFQKNDKEKARQYLKAAREKGLDQARAGARGLHTLEQPAYRKLLSELGFS